MRALVARLTGKQNQDDPINIHVTVFWATVFFWTIALTAFVILNALP